MPANRKPFILTRRIIAAATILLLLQHTAMAGVTEDKNTLWKTANAQYAQKQYDGAAATYEQLLASGSNNIWVHYNLANAYYRLNKVGPAILHYEKALQLDPHNKLVQDNLRLAKGRVLNPLAEFPPIFFIRWWDNLVHAFSPDVWAWLSFIVFTGILAVIYFARLRKEQFSHSGRWLSVGVTGLLICGCMAFFTYQARQDSGKAVVMQTGINFLESPQQNGKILGTLPEGTVLQVSQEQNDFYNVKLPNGREGWVAASDLKKV